MFRDCFKALYGFSGRKQAGVRVLDWVPVKQGVPEGPDNLSTKFILLTMLLSDM